MLPPLHHEVAHGEVGRAVVGREHAHEPVLAVRQLRARRDRHPLDRERLARPVALERPARGLDAARVLRMDDGQGLLRVAHAEAAGGDEARQAQHVVRVPVGDQEVGRREHLGAEPELQALAGVDDEAERAVPEPVAEEAPAEAGEDIVHGER